MIDTNETTKTESHALLSGVRLRLISPVEVEERGVKTLGDVVRLYKTDASDDIIQKWLYKAAESCLYKHMNPDNHYHLIPEIYYVSREFLNKA